MKSILLISHGSRVDASNNEIIALAESLERKVEYPVQAAFLEIAEPSIMQGFDRLLEARADEIIVLPYFLSKGRHVTEDVPRIIGECRDAHPDIKVDYRDYIGAGDAMLELLVGMI